MQAKNIKSKSRVGFMVVWVAFFICLGIIGGEIYAAKQSKPMLIPGKRTLYQKVITHPGTTLYALAGNSSKVLEKWVKPFTVFYVYQRASVGGEPWLEVGLSSTEGTVGWIKGSKTSDWNQALTLVFSERTGRCRDSIGEHFPTRTIPGSGCRTSRGSRLEKAVLPHPYFSSP
jgi:hypothetical protein